MKASQIEKWILTGMIIIAGTSLGCSKVGFDNSPSSSKTSGQGVDTGADTGAGGTVTANGDPTRDGSGSIDTTTSTCTTQVQQITYPVKIIFVVDASGSNVNDEKSDPLRNFRYYSLRSFLDKFAAKSNFSYQMIHFKGSNALTYIADSNNTPVFSHVGDMRSALNWFMTNVTDSGTTPYKAAMTNIRDVINRGGTDAPNTRYAVVFLTDGLPTDYLKTVSDPTGYSCVFCDYQSRVFKVVDEQPILDDVLSTVNVKPNITTFSTVYYGRNSQWYTDDAKNRLQRMASVGKGRFFDASRLENIRIEDTLSLPNVTCTP